MTNMTMMRMRGSHCDPNGRWNPFVAAFSNWLDFDGYHMKIHVVVPQRSTEDGLEGATNVFKLTWLHRFHNHFYDYLNK